MSDRIGQVAGVPLSVSIFNPVLKRLLAVGLPMGFNGLVTIRGRKSGLPRTTPVAIIEVSGRRWVWAPWGDVHWVRNLRAAGRPPSPCAAETKKSRRPSWIRHSELRSFATRLVQSREASRSVSGSFASSMGSISTNRWKRPRVAVSSNSTLCDKVGKRPVDAPRGTPGTETGPEGPGSVRSFWWAILDSNQ